MRTLIDIDDQQAELEHIDARAKLLKPLAFVTLSTWQRKPHWWASAHYLDLTASADEPGEALAALSRLIERRFASDAAIARTLGIADDAA